MNEPDPRHMRMSFDLAKGAEEGGPAPERPGPAPFQVLALADFGGAAPSDAPERVTRDTFDAVLAGRRVRLDLEVPNHLGAGPARMVLTLAPEALADLTPAGLVARVPELRALHALWRAVAAPGAGADTPAVRTALSACEGHAALGDAVATVRRALAGPPAAAPPGPPAGGDDTPDRVDRILGMLQEAPAAAPRFPSGAGGPAADLARRLAAQVTAVLHDPAFRALEAAWRGLRLLLWAADPRGGVRVWLLDRPADARDEALADGGPVAALHDGPEGPLSLLVADALAGPRTPDVDALQALGEAAEALRVPLVAGLDPAFFGEPGHRADRLPFLGTVLEGAAYAPWRALRGKDAARWLVAGYNRPLLRAPYGEQDRKGAGLAEPTAGPEDLLWGNPAWAIAALGAAAFDRDGWAGGLSGADGAIAGMPLWRPPEGAAELPLEAALPDKVLQDIAGAGAAPLACRPNRDSVFAPRVPTVHLPDTYDDPAATEAARAMARLGYQLVAGRVTAALARHLATLPEDLPADAAAREVEAFLADLLATTGPGSEARVTAADGALDVRLRTGRDVLGGSALRLMLPWGAA